MNNNSKPSLRERIAALKAEKSKKTSSRSTQEAKTRVAASWTIAKTLLPTAPNDVQFKLASSLLGNTTQALTAMLRQTAVNAHYTKLAEKFEQMHKVELNEFIEDPSFLEKMKGEVEKELKGEPKNAKRKNAGEGNEEALAPVEDNEEMNKAPEEEENLAPEGEEEVAPEGDDLGMGDDMGEAAGSPADEKKEVIQEQIQAVKDDVDALEAEILEGEELDFSEVFNESNMDDKVDNLANEDENEEGEEGEEDDYFSPSDAQGMEAGMDGTPEVTDSSYFSHGAATASMDALFDDTRTAAKDKVYDQGDISDTLMGGDVADAEEDHADDILYDTLKGLKILPFNEGGYKRDSEPKFEEPKKTAKAASQAGRTPAPESKKRPIRSLGNVKTSSAERSKEQSMLASLVFPDDEGF